MTERDARDLVDWLDQAEEETKATIAEHERIDPFYDGVLSTVQTVREYIKKMRKVDEAEGEKQMKEIITDSKFEHIEEDFLFLHALPKFPSVHHAFSVK